MQSPRFFTRLSFFTICLLLTTNLLHSQSNYRISQAEVPSWVQLVEPRLNAKVPDYEINDGVLSLLYDTQYHHPKKTSYRHRCNRILNEAGLESFSELRVNFDPAYEKPILHYLRVYRNGQVLNRLKMNSIVILQMERRSDLHLYDGSLSALIFIEDLRIGDILEFAYSIEGEQPILGDHISTNLYFSATFPIDQLFLRQVLPIDSKDKLRYLNDGKNPEVSNENGYKVYTWHEKEVPATLYEANVPSYYHPFPSVQISDYENWEEVKTEIETLFKKVDWQGAAVKTLADSIRTSSNDSLEMALAAIRFVQDEIRYLGFEGGINGFQPHPSAQTLDQRFGDCKDKSLLLVGLLNSIGFRAWPVLVHTANRGKIQAYLPDPLSFNHCVVKLRIGNADFWVDPTNRNQGGLLASLCHPNWEKGLVLCDGDSGLADIEMVAIPSTITVNENWEIGGVGEPVTLSISTIFEGIEADIMRSQLQATSQKELEQQYSDYVSRIYGKIEQTNPFEILDDRDSNRLVLIETYVLLNPWSQSRNSEKSQTFDIVPSLLTDYVKYISQVERKQPWALEYPLKYKCNITTHFPKAMLIAEDIVEVIAKEFDFKCLVTSRPGNRIFDVHFSFENNSEVVEASDFGLFAEKLSEVQNTMVFQVKEDMYALREPHFSFGVGAIVLVAALLLLGLCTWGLVYFIKKYL